MRISQQAETFREGTCSSRLVKTIGEPLEKSKEWGEVGVGT